VPIFLVIGLADSGPYPTHEFIMVVGAIMEAAVSLSKRVGLLSGCYEIPLWGKPRNHGPLFSASG